jgi:hypothetical protein
MYVFIYLFITLHTGVVPEAGVRVAGAGEVFRGGRAVARPRCGLAVGFTSFL